MPTQNEQEWEELVAEFQRFCVLRSQGEETASRQVLNERVPSKIAAWSRSSGAPAAEKRAVLTRMFKLQQQRVEDLLLLSEFSTRRWQEEVLPMVRDSIGWAVRRALSDDPDSPAPQAPSLGQSRYRPLRRPAFDDIQGIIDLIQREEARSDRRAMAVTLSAPRAGTLEQTCNP